jgi:protein O-GlcNAc transferase
MNVAPELGRALRLHQEGKFVEAEQICRSVLDSTPDQFDAMHLLAFMKSQKGQLEEAQHLLASALRHNPRSAEAWLNLGTVLTALKRPAEALASFDRGIALRPDNAEAHDHRGRLLVELKRHEEAVASFDRAIASRPGFAGTHNNRGVALRNLGRAEEALESFDRAAALKPDNAGVYNNRGNALRDLKQPQKALESFERALALKPDLVEAHNNRGFALCDLKRHDEALGSFDRAIALKPGYVEAINGRGIALFELKRPDEALESFGRALALQPGYAEAHVSRGNALIELRRPGEALESYKRAFSLNPDHPFAFGLLANAALHCCDWATARQVAQDLDARIDDGRSIVPPFALLGYPASALTQLKCARNFSRYKIPYRSAPLWRGESARGRLVKAFDQFHDARGVDDRSVASLLREAEVDIAVNLTGYTQNSRPEIFAHRPAPVQASFLGYPGTMGGDFIDYLIADPIVLPFDQQPYYTEKIVHLPDCYQANDRKRAIAATTSSRKAESLPDKGLVFCCFNNSWKIAEPIFDIWMDLLRAVEGSVLWLLRDNDSAAESLRGAALARGVDPARIVFAERIGHAEHLARHRLADLFLDTLPYNAHATASDALWAGLPLLTSTGSTFASRVATSLLHAVGMPELAAASLDDYRALALTLATDPDRLRSLRRKLEQNRSVCPLFDTDRFRLHIEAAYEKMWQLRQRGENPRPFGVEAG